MAKIETGKKDIIWSYISSLINSTINLIALPLILTKLSSSDTGLWYVFLSVSSIVSFIDFGFSPTIIRNISYCWCGATVLFTEGLPKSSSNNETNYSLLKSLLLASRRIYNSISLTALVIMLTGGSFYILSILESINIQYVFAWIIFSISISTNLYFSYYNIALKAVGAITISNKINTLSRLLYLVILTFGLLLGHGIIVMSISNLFYSIILGFLSKHALGKILGSNYKSAHHDGTYSMKKIFAIIIPNAKKSGAVSIVTFVMVRFNTLLAASFMGLEISASYSIAVQIFEAIGEISKITFNTFIPKFTSLLIENNYKKLKDVFSFTIFLQWIIGIIGLVAFIIIGDKLLMLIGSSTFLPSKNILIIMAIMVFLGWNHSSFATYITLNNTVPFLKAGIISATVMCTVSILLLNFTNMELWALILPRFFVALAYENWKWPSVACRNLNISIFDILKRGINQIKGVLIYEFKTIKLSK